MRGEQWAGRLCRGLWRWWRCQQAQLQRGGPGGARARGADPDEDLSRGDWCIARGGGEVEFEFQPDGQLQRLLYPDAALHPAAAQQLRQ
ncbi:hypothetical protein MARPU_07090 [Marichromatium purpuratum 984]|uniref:Uncharacterized protein n=1 Tax=Marichromatium purpuratum 984 TaxID=765910 RepID=W0E896_MARPU|nr:hypothetical protein MARPU_07090 [Marichromatium purpuratum 984]